MDEFAEDGKSCFATLPEGSRAEVDAGIFTANPIIAHQSWRNAHEPSVCMIVACACLAAKLSVGIEGANVVPQAAARAR